MAIYGLSADDLDSHQAFANKHTLNFPLLSDVNHTLIEQLGAWGEKEFEGKKFMGIIRTTVLVGPDGRVEQIWEKVKFQDHAEAVLQAIRG